MLSMLRRATKVLTATLLVSYLTMGLFLYLNQRNFLYFPTPNLKSNYEQMNIKNSGASINIIVLNRGYENAILYFGGNAESMANSSDYIAKQFPKFTVYLMDYRGYGASSGEASEKALYSDALKLYDTIKPSHNRISIGGRSLGSGIATFVASKREVSKLALITPFDSILSVAQERYPVYPVSWLLEDIYDSASRAKYIDAKTFIVIAEEDSVIPLKNTQKLINAFSEEKLEVEVIKKRGHVDISSDARYYKIMQKFIGDG